MVGRRGFLKGGAALAAGAWGAGSLGGCAPAPDPVRSSGPAGEAGIDHIVVLMMENRSFDHFLGWLPGADGKQAGLSFPGKDGAMHPTHHLTQFASCDYKDPDHSYSGGRREYNGGRCDGWLTQSPDDFPIGYYEAADLSFFGNVAPAFTVCDRYFAATMGPTFPNRIFHHAGQTDRDHNTLDISTLPTIWDRLFGAGLQGRYYFSDAPVTALWGAHLLPITRTIDGFFEDCRTGRLPNVSYVDPRFLIPPLGTSGDDHPASDIRAGEQFLTEVYRAVTSSPNWARTVFVVNFDEWGGFYDHVAPEEAPDSNPATALRGFRVPNVVISPLAKRGHVAHDTYDHASVLKMIEWAWDLEPLAPRDAAANNLADVLDLGGVPNLDVPHWEAPSFEPIDCSAHFFDDIFGPLLAQARDWGFAT
ncbi:MAG: alkaline phosphatase family protein [Acidimicrobiales bacterium]